jgi:hypothetical protein
LLTPGWLARHALAVALVVAMLWLAKWQIGRAAGGNTLSYAYAVEWPVFAAFVVALWVREVRAELRAARGAEPEPPPADDYVARLAAAPPRRAAAPAPPAPVDDEVEAYNRYLEWLNANPGRRPSEYPG